MQTYKPLAVVCFLLAACAAPTTTLRFHEQVNDAMPATRLRMVDVPRTGQQVAVDPFAQITERDVYEAHLEPTPGGQAVRIKFDLHGANKLSELTTRMRGRYIVVFVDDQPVAAVLVKKRITNGEFLLETGMTEAETQALVGKLRRITGKNRDFGDTPLAP